MRPAWVAAPGVPTADPLSVAVMESQARISGGTALYTSGSNAAFTGALGVRRTAWHARCFPLYRPNLDGQLKNQVRCAYVVSANTAATFGNPAALDPTKDTAITGGAAPIFTATDFQDNDVQATATVMKLVINGYAGAGTIAMGGYDYHDGTRATGETRNFKAGQMIGAVLEYAQRVGKPVMVYVFSDGSLTSTGMPDDSTAGAVSSGGRATISRWLPPSSWSTAPRDVRSCATVPPDSRPGYFSSDGSVVDTSSPVANNVTSLVQAVILNYMGLLGTDGQFPTLFQGQGLGSGSALAALTAFAPL